MIEPDIADLDNAPAGGLGGAITAALFLRRFVDDPEKYAHFDIFAWSAQNAPGGQRVEIPQACVLYLRRYQSF
jgi:leucyl aminopeptidase